MTGNEIVQWVNMASGIATAVGVAVAAIGLWISRAQVKTQFEDQMTTEYRNLIKELPVDALLESDEAVELNDDLLNKIYNYVDFTNEQVFLRQKGRIRRATWALWVEGIEANLSKPVIRSGWQEIRKRSKSFSELRVLEELSFRCDPRSSKYKKSLAARTVRGADAFRSVSVSTQE